LVAKLIRPNLEILVIHFDIYSIIEVEL